MNMLHVANLPIYYGAIVASICGYVVSITIALKYLKINYKFNYKEAINNFIKTIIPMIFLIIFAVLLNKLIVFNDASRKMMVIKVIIIALPTAVAYIYALFKLKVIDTIFGKDFFPKIKNKLLRKMHK